MDEQYIVDIKVKTPGVEPATKKIKALEEELSKLEKTSESYKQKTIEIGRVQSAAGQSVQKFSKTISDVKGSVGTASTGVSNLSGLLSGLGGPAGIAASAALAVGAAIATVGVAALELNKEFKKVDKTLKSTGAQGEALKNLGNQAKFLQEQFDIDPTEFAAAINNVVEAYGVTQEEAGRRIEQAALAGANSTGALTDNINEYINIASQGGVAIDAFFDKNVLGAQRGTLAQDKLNDSTKELGLRLNANSKATQAALKPLGDQFTKELTIAVQTGAKSSDEALIAIIDRTRELGLTFEQQAAIVSDVGGTQVEDLAGLDKTYKLLTDSIGAQNRALSSLTTEEINANARAKEKIELQRKLSEDVGSQLQRVSDAFTDAFYDVLQSLDLGGEGFKNLADEVIKWIEKGQKYYKDIIFLFGEVIKYIDETIDGLGFIGDAIKFLSDGFVDFFMFQFTAFPKLIGYIADTRRELQKPVVDVKTIKTYKDLQDTLNKTGKAYGDFSKSASDASAKVKQEAENSIFKAKVDTKKGEEQLTPAEVQAITDAANKRFQVIEGGQARILKSKEFFKDALSKVDEETLKNALAVYEKDVNAASVANLNKGEADLAAIKAADDNLTKTLASLDKKVTATTGGNKKIKASVVDLAAIEKKRFEDLKKSFETNFELQRLEAQKDFASGLINEKELREKIFAINQQENAVIITITANKKEIAKTGEETLEISKVQLKNATEIKQELQAQLDIVNRIKEADKIGVETNDKLDEGYAKIELNKKIQEILDNDSIKGEKKKQKAIDALNREAAVNQLAKLKQDEKEAFKVSQDAQEAADKLAAEDDLTSTDAGLKAIKDVSDAELNLLAIRMKASDVEDEIANKDRENKKKTLTQIAEQTEKINGYIQEVTQGFQQALQADIALTESKLQQQEVRIAAGVELAKMGNDELLNQELERQDKLLEERKKQANKEKAIAAIQMASNLAVAITKAASEGGIFAPATIALVLGAVGIGLASVSGLVAGAFADGVIDFQGKGTGRSDSNIVAISHGESVITANGTKNASKMLTMINEGKLKDSDYLSSGLNLEMIEDTGGMIDIRTELNEQISISRELLDEMKNFEKKVNFSAEGVTEYVRTKDKIQTKLNTR